MKLFALFSIFLAAFAFAKPPAAVTPTAPPSNAVGLGSAGDEFYYTITGGSGGFGYGTGVYTVDSSIGFAAVHSGVVGVGETAIVKLTLLGSRPSFFGSTQNGRTSFSWAASFDAFTLERCPDTDFNITAQPNSTVSATGSSVTLTVATDGSGISYQWYKGTSGDESSPISGETSASFAATISTTQTSYWVKVTNASGSLNSATATLTPTITTTTLDWQDITVSVPGALSTENTGPLHYSNGELYLLGSNSLYRSTDNGASFTPINAVSGTTSYDLADDTMRFIEGAGSYIYTGTDPGSFALTLGFPPLHRIQTGGTAWAKAAQTDIPGSAFGDTTEDVAYDPATGTYYAASRLDGVYTSSDGLTWTQSANGLGSLNGFSVVVENGIAYLCVIEGGGFLVYQSTDQGANWSVTATHPAIYPGAIAPLGFFKGGANSTHVFSGRQFSANNGLSWDDFDRTGLPSGFNGFAVEATDQFVFLLAMNSSSEVRLFRRTIASMPLIQTTQWLQRPSVANNHVNAGQTVTIEALAAGANVLYQWSKDGNVIPGATSPTLTLADVTTSDTGTYSLFVVSANGTLMSDVSLSVLSSDPGFQDFSFTTSIPNARRGMGVVLDNGRIVQIEAPVMQLRDADGTVLVDQVRSTPIIRQGFADSNGDIIGWGEFAIERYDPTTLNKDASFATATFGGARGVRVLDVDEIPGQGYVVGLASGSELNGAAVFSLLLLNYDGTLNTSFANPFQGATPNFSPAVSELEVTSSGKIIAKVSTTRWSNGDSISNNSTVRLNSDGTRDSSYGTNGTGAIIGEEMTLQPDGKLLYADSSNERRPQRLNADGTQDTAFNSNGILFEDTIYGFIPTTGGEIFVYGEFENYDGNIAKGHARLNADGSFDTSYNADEGFEFFGNHRNINHAAYDANRGVIYYVGDGGVFRPASNTLTNQGMVRVFTGGASSGGSIPSFATFVSGLPAADQAADANPDGDDFDNGVEYLFGLDPAAFTTPAAANAAMQATETTVTSASLGLTPGETYYTYSFCIPNERTSINWSLQATRDVSNPAAKTPATLIGTEPNTTCTRYTYRMPWPTSDPAGRGFFFIEASP